MNVCQTHVTAMPTVVTPKVPLTVNVILGILGMALIVPVSKHSNCVLTLYKFVLTPFNHIM